MIGIFMICSPLLPKENYIKMVPKVIQTSYFWISIDFFIFLATSN